MKWRSFCTALACFVVMAIPLSAQVTNPPTVTAIAASAVTAGSFASGGYTFPGLLTHSGTAPQETYSGTGNTQFNSAQSASSSWIHNTTTTSTNTTTMFQFENNGTEKFEIGSGGNVSAAGSGSFVGLAAGGALTGVTSITMTAGISGATTAGFSGAVTVGSLNGYHPTSGSISCTLATATSCTQTATVPSGVVCSASYDSSSTALASDFIPLLVGVSGTTLTLTGQTNASISGSLVMDYTCL
jgi:hypothetical protein